MFLVSPRYELTEASAAETCYEPCTDDSSWVTPQGHSCAEIEGVGAADWVSPDGVRADVACCEFGGGTTSGSCGSCATVSTKSC